MFTFKIKMSFGKFVTTLLLMALQKKNQEIVEIRVQMH